MITYITGDTHGKFDRIDEFCRRIQPAADDTLIILGDAGFNYYRNKRDAATKAFASGFPCTLFCIHGNHEIRPQNIPTYKERVYHGGRVLYEEAYPNIVFAIDGEIYDFDGFKCIVIGGAYSVDKYYRLARGWAWFSDEQPSDEIKRRVEERLEAENYCVDIVLSHTCPLRYQPIEAFISTLDQSTVDASTEEWLGKLEEKLTYKKWYCGHFHIAKRIDRIQFMFEDFDVLSIHNKKG